MSVKLSDIGLETMIVGGMYKDPNLYIEYGSSIKSKYDFSDDTTKFLYDAFELFYTTYSTEVTEMKVNSFMMQDEDRKKTYKSFGGWKLVQKAIDLVSVDDYENHYDSFKKYSLLREYEKKGFPIEKLTNHPKFSKLRADQITQWLRATVDKVHTVIGGGNDSVRLGHNAKEMVEGWMKVPAMGIELPWDMWTTLFRGWGKKKLIVDGMLSNEGKSRRMTFLVAYSSLILGKKCFVGANEMDEEDLLAGMITAVCNNPVFGFNYKIPEGNIVLGQYEDDEQYRRVCEVAEYIQNNTKIFMKEMDDYSDTAIEHEIKKHVLGYGVECVFYDTLKGYRTDNWEVVKQTTTKIRDLCKEMNVRGYATIQLTDDSFFVDVMDFSSNNIANAKQLKHVVDHMLLEKKISPEDYNLYTLTDEWGVQMTLEEYNRGVKHEKWFYYGQKVDKNRKGSKGMVLCTRVNLDLNVWEEIGILTRTEGKKPKSNNQRYNKK